MFVKVQFLKGAMCVALYFVIYVAFVKIRRNFNSKEITNIVTTNNQPITFHSSFINKINKKDIELEIDMLRVDELKGETIDLQVYLKIPRIYIFISIRYYQTEKNRKLNV